MTLTPLIISQDTLLEAANQVSKAVPLMLAMPISVDQVTLTRVGMA